MFAAWAARCPPGEGQGRNGAPAGRQFAVVGGAALVPRGGGPVLLFSAKALLIAPQPLRGVSGGRPAPRLEAVSTYAQTVRQETACRPDAQMPAPNLL
jgi:hypothetical protein